MVRTFGIKSLKLPRLNYPEMTYSIIPFSRVKEFGKEVRVKFGNERRHKFTLSYLRGFWSYTKILLDTVIQVYK